MKSSKLILNITQVNERLCPTKSDFQPAKVRILAGKQTNDPNNPFKYVLGDFDVEKDFISVKSQDVLEAGIYYAKIYFHTNLKSKIIVIPFVILPLKNTLFNFVDRRRMKMTIRKLCWIFF